MYHTTHFKHYIKLLLFQAIILASNSINFSHYLKLVILFLERYIYPILMNIDVTVSIRFDLELIYFCLEIFAHEKGYFH